MNLTVNDFDKSHIWVIAAGIVGVICFLAALGYSVHTIHKKSKRKISEVRPNQTDTSTSV